MATIKISNYVTWDELKLTAPNYCKKYRNARELIKAQENIDYLFARQKDDKWIKSNGKSNKFDKVFFTASFAKSIKENESIKLAVEDAPPIIELEDHEKFFYDEGDICEIETRGKRNHKEIHFKVRDISKCLDMKKLSDTITDKQKGGYIKGIHYNLFICNGNNNTKHKILFLIFTGML